VDTFRYNFKNISPHDIAQIFIPSALLNNYEFSYNYYPKETAVRIEVVRILHLHFAFYILALHLVPFNLSMGRAFNNYSPHHKGRRNVKYAIKFLTPIIWYQSPIPSFHMRILKKLLLQHSFSITIAIKISLPFPLGVIVVTWGVWEKNVTHEPECDKVQGTNEVPIHV
jgi:hypothetical protein